MVRKPEKTLGYSFKYNNIDLKNTVNNLKY